MKINYAKIKKYVTVGLLSTALLTGCGLNVKANDSANSIVYSDVLQAGSYIEYLKNDAIAEKDVYVIYDTKGMHNSKDDVLTQDIEVFNDEQGSYEKVTSIHDNGDRSEMTIRHLKDGNIERVTAVYDKDGNLESELQVLHDAGGKLIQSHNLIHGSRGTFERTLLCYSDTEADLIKERNSQFIPNDDNESAIFYMDDEQGFNAYIYPWNQYKTHELHLKNGNIERVTAVYDKDGELIYESRILHDSNHNIIEEYENDYDNTKFR